MTNSEPVFAAPEENVETQPFWDAARRGVLMIKRCDACTTPHYYPRAICPHCGAADTRWEAATGTGTLYSVSVMRRGPGAPFAIGYVTLDEGPAVVTRIVNVDLDTLRIGQRLRIHFTETEGAPVPTFTRAAD